MSGFELDDGLKKIERQIQSWGPAGCGIDRDRLIYEAGRASLNVGPRPVLWRLATAASLLLAVGLGWAWIKERDQRQSVERELAAVRQVVSPDAPVLADAPAPPSHPADPSSYIVLTRDLRGAADPLLAGEKAVGGGGPPRPLPDEPLTPGRVHSKERLFDL